MLSAPYASINASHYVTPSHQKSFYKAAITAKTAKTAPMALKEQEIMFAGLVEIVPGVPGPVGDDLVAALRPDVAVPAGTVILLPELPVAVAEAPIIPFPAPSDGVSPLPAEAADPELETSDEAALADEDGADPDAADDSGVDPLPPETTGEVEDDGLADEPATELAVETSLQDKS